MPSIRLNQSNVRPVALFLLAIILFLPTWLWLGEAWLSDPYYSHGPLVLIVSAYFVWARRKSISENSAPSHWGWVPFLAALALHLWAMGWRAFYLSALMIPLLLFGLLNMLYGARRAKKFLFPLAFLVLMVPLPVAERFGPMLAGWTATSATVLAQFIGIAAMNNGSQVFVPNSTFSVGIPCGGLDSAISILTLATLLAYIVHGPLWARGAVFLAAIPIALTANILRLSLLFAIAANWDAQVGLDYFHSWSSAVLFLSAFALLIRLANLLGCSRVRWESILPA